MDDFLDLLIKQKWQEVTSAFHSFISGIWGYIIIIVACFLVVWGISHITMKRQKHT